MSGRRLLACLKRFPQARLLVVGDVMLDQFIWGRVERISPEAPVPVVEVVRESFHLGGAANVAANVAALGGQVSVCGIIGNDLDGRRTLAALAEAGVGADGIVRSKQTPTVSKTRIVAHHQQVVRVDREQRQQTPADKQRLRAYLRRAAADFDAIILSDYGKGVLDEESLAELGAMARARGTRLVVDPKRRNYPHYRGITLATPNAAETAEAAEVDLAGGDTALAEAGRRLLERWQAQAILITRGEHGMTLVEPGRSLRHFPTTSRQVYDVTGAGDTVVATCTLALASGASLAEAAQLANHAAGIVVAKLGTATASADELAAALRGRS